MGSFNMTCVASQQTIAPGDACRVLPLLQQSTYESLTVTKGDREAEAIGPSRSTCHYESFWTPMGGTIRGRYDDYGRVSLELDDDASRINMMAFIRYLRAYAWKTPQGENPYHDHAFDIEQFLAEKTPDLLRVLNDQLPGDEHPTLDKDLESCWGYVWEVAGKFRLFASDYKGRPSSLNFAFIHEEAYTYIVEENAKVKDWSGDSRDPVDVLKAVFDEAMGIIGDVKELESESERKFAGFALSNKVRERFNYADGVGRHMGVPMSSTVDELCEAFLMGQLDDEQVLGGLLPLLQDRYFLAGMDLMNLRLIPVSSSGQDYQNEIGQEYAKFIAAVSPRISRGRLLEMYGEFQPYVMSVLSQVHLDTFVDNMTEWDAAIEGIIATPLENGTLEVQFDCTLDSDIIKELIEETFEGDGDAIMRETLRQRDTVA